MSSEPKLVKRYAEILGTNCEGCTDTTKFLDMLKDKSSVPITYSKIEDMNSERAKQIIESKKLAKENGDMQIPYIKKCDVYEDGNEKCEDIIGFSESDFKNWDDKQQQQQQTASEPVAATTQQQEPKSESSEVSVS